MKPEVMDTVAYEAFNAAGYAIYSEVVSELAAKVGDRKLVIDQRELTRVRKDIEKKVAELFGGSKSCDDCTGCCKSKHRKVKEYWFSVVNYDSLREDWFVMDLTEEQAELMDFLVGYEPFLPNVGITLTSVNPDPKSHYLPLPHTDDVELEQR